MLSECFNHGSALAMKTWFRASTMGAGAHLKIIVIQCQKRAGQMKLSAQNIEDTEHK